ncbi:MAG: malate dehydrogenase, partial [Rhodocyclaceae bacterium]|nr:malate dehydrogenase [Rhodocyclaceae bacterium]
ASAANAALTHIRDWILGSEGRWLTMGVCSDGSYDIPAGLIYGMPVTTEGGKWRIVQNLSLDAFSRSKLDADASALQEERDNIKHLLK